MKLLHFLFFILFECNFSYINGLTAETIRGGRTVNVGKVKYIAAVIYKPTPDTYINPCTASIIGNKHALTVAHCFYDKLQKSFIKEIFYIVVAVSDLKNPSSSTRYIPVDYIVVPSYYNFDEEDTYSTVGDLAIVKLSEELGLRENHPSLHYLFLSQQDIKNYDQDFRVYGYGWNEVNTDISNNTVTGQVDLESGWSDGKLRHILVKVLKQPDCENILRNRIAPGNLCAKAIQNSPTGQPTGICEYDSGAPILHLKRSRLYAIAIKAFMGCDERQMPSIYLEIAQYRIFIENAMELIKTRLMSIYQIQPDPDSVSGVSFQPIPDLV